MTGGINLPTGGITFPTQSSTAAISWGNNFSNIYDNGDLHINTDDELYISAPTLLSITSNTVDVSGNIVTSGTLGVTGLSTLTGGINLPTGGITFPTQSSTAAISWGNNFSNIYDNGDLHINTDDNLYISAPTLLSITSNTVTINGNINLPIGGITFPTQSSTAAISWGNNFSNIYDNGDLHINTDDNLYISAPTLLSITSNTVTISGNVTANSFSATSDYRIKEDIKPLKLEEYSVDNLNPVTFKFKKDGKESIGLIAHELQEHYPYLVEGGKDGEQTQTVNYNGLIGVLIKEIQELKKRVKELENKIE